MPKPTTLARGKGGPALVAASPVRRGRPPKETPLPALDVALCAAAETAQRELQRTFVDGALNPRKNGEQAILPATGVE